MANEQNLTQKGKTLSTEKAQLANLFLLVIKW